jgi:pimeloyl-ACP methyl ester carboxylesterase
MKTIAGELVSFQTKDGLLLHGFLVRSKTKSNKALVHIHGMEGTFYRGYYAKVLAKKLSESGFNYLSIEQRGSYTALGLRRQKGKKLRWVAAGGGFEVFEDSVYDIDAAVGFLRSIGMKEIHLEGHSTGCQKATYYMYKKKDKRVKSIILAAPCDDYNIQKENLGKRFAGAVKIARELYKKDKSAEMPRTYIKRSFGAGRFLSISDLKFVESRLFNYDLPKLKEFSTIKKPILAMFGSKDENAIKPVSEYMRILEKNTGSAKFEYSIIKNTDHGFDGKEKEAASIMVNWLKRIS